MFGFPRLNKKLKSWNEIEFQEVLLDSLVQKKEKELGAEGSRLELPIAPSSLFLARIIILGTIAVLLWQTLYLQIIKGDEYAVLALKNRLVETQIAPVRGVIYDVNMEQLVFNRPALRLMVDKRKLAGNRSEKNKIIENIAGILGKDPAILLEELEGDSSLIEPVAVDISRSQLLAFRERQEDFPGFFVEESYTRRYPDGSVFSHLVGYTGKVSEKELMVHLGYTGSDYIGKTGLEKSYEDILRGRPGIKEVLRDAKEAVLEEKVSTQPEPGNSLVLWVDADLQIKAAEELTRIMETVGSKKGAVVAIDPRNGGVLAMVNKPSFDNNLFAEGISAEGFQVLLEDPYNPLFPRTISGQYPIGSAVKPLLAAAALQEEIIKEDTELFAPLELCVKNIYSGAKECYKDWTFHGWTDLRRAIAESVNPFFYIIGGGYKKNEFSDHRLPDVFGGLGAERIKKYISLFGMGQKLGIDLSGESSGRAPDPAWKESYFENPEDKLWYLGDTYNLSIGQGFLLATPLQVASAFSAIANGGTLYMPRVTQKIVDSEKNTIREISPEVIRYGFIAPEYLGVVKEGMRDAVRYGSSVMLNNLPVPVAAKTGTAQISASSNLYYNWVTVFAPYDDPEIVLTVLIEDVEGLRAAALPVAKEILEWYFTRQ